MQDCKNIQKNIVPFTMGTLSLKDEEKFIKHLEDCADCREELEIHYIVAYGLTEDDEERMIQPKYRDLLERFDFKGLVDLKLQDSRNKIEKVKYISRMSMLSVALTNICMILAWIIRIILRYY